jgi:predicted  nucleic acid-binding Zn-ribbon protein
MIAKLTRLRNDRIRLAESVDRLSAERDALRDERDEARSEVERLKDRCASYCEDVDSLNECVSRLEADLHEARDESAKLREALSDIATWRESSYGGVLEIVEFAREALCNKVGAA